jgi:gliding motility-associated-like protein
MIKLLIRTIKIVLIINIFLILGTHFALSQAPAITYTTPNTYYLGNLITPLAPKNTGGAVFNYGETTTVAGSGYSGYTDGIGTNASFYNPLVTALDAAGNIYVADAENHVVRKIAPNGTVTTLAGNGSIGSSDGIGSQASFFHPAGLAVDKAGNVFVADEDNNTIRKITPAGVVTTFAGSGNAGAVDGIGRAASLWFPCGIALDADENLYVAEYNNHIIRKISPAGVVTTFAGSTTAGFADGTASNARFRNPISVAVDPDGNVYVADRLNQKIRKITPGGMVSTLAGSGLQGAADGPPAAASFNYPTSITIDNRGYLYVADKNNNNIRRVSPTGVVSTTAGTTTPGSADGIRERAAFNSTFGIVSDGTSYLYVADLSNHKIRRVVSAVYILSPTNLPPGLTFDEITGIISGTPTTVWPTTIYTVTAFNPAGSSSTQVSITVIDPITPSITAGSLTGTMSTCAGTPSVSYQQFNLSGDNLQSPVTATAPSGFEVATSATGIYGPSVSFTPVNNKVNAVVYVRLAATAPAGHNAGNIAIQTTGLSNSTFGVSGKVNPLPVINSISNQVVCATSATAAVNFSGSIGNTYQWTNNSPLIGLPATGSGNISAFNAVNTGNSPITATITVTTVNDNSECIGQPSVFTITVNPTVKPAVSIAASVANPICEGASVTFTATATEGGLNPAYQWKLNGVNTGTNSNTLNNSNLKNGDIITCVLTSNSTACLSTLTATSNSITVNVNEPITPLIIVQSPAAICAANAATFVAIVTNAGVNPIYQWRVNGQIAGTNTSSFTSSKLNNGDQITCTVSNPANCVTSATSNPVTIKVVALPTLATNEEYVVNIGESIQLDPKITGSIVSYKWSPSTNLSNANIRNPLASPAATTIYNLTVTTSSGCTVTVPITVKALNNFPNTFTPNADGVNDLWELPFLTRYPNCTVNIYNRYGSIIHQSTGYPTPWDGTFKGQPLPAGTYYYVIKLSNNMKPLSGPITILR